MHNEFYKLVIDSVWPDGHKEFVCSDRFPSRWQALKRIAHWRKILKGSATISASLSLYRCVEHEIITG